MNIYKLSVQMVFQHMCSICTYRLYLSLFPLQLPSHLLIIILLLHYFFFRYHIQEKITFLLFSVTYHNVLQFCTLS